MNRKEHTLTVRIPRDVLLRLRTRSESNYCSVSDIARDILLVATSDEEPEHIFVEEETWKKAVRSRDYARCTHCGSKKDLEVYPVVPFVEGGSTTLSNGQTLCFACYQQHQPLDVLEENGETIYAHVPQGWIRTYQQARDKGKIFWERRLACFLTRRKRAFSPIVEWYAEMFLREVPEDVLIRTLVELCPTPDIIAEFPGRRSTSTNETFAPPPLIWHDGDRSEAHG